MRDMTQQPPRPHGSTKMCASLLPNRAWRSVVAAGAVLMLAACDSQSPAPSVVTAETAPLRSDAEIRDLDIIYFTERAERDPTGASDLARLGALHLARARDTGDPRDVLLAETVARKSLRNRSSHNSAAESVLQSSLLAQHRFAEALVLARAARDAEPDKAVLRAAVGEIQMELGQYDSARVSFANLHAPLGDLAIAPRLARWAEIEGQPDRARRMLRAALANALREPALPREQVAWYHLRVGDVELRMGRPAAADTAYRAGLAIHAGDYRLLSALAHSALVQHRWRDAIDYGEQAIAATLDPATLGTLSDAHAALGDSVKSAEYAAALDVTIRSQPGAYHRAWSLFLLDHQGVSVVEKRHRVPPIAQQGVSIVDNRHRVSSIERKIREELDTRQDIYAYDLLAWSLHKRGRNREAAVAMARALQQKTQDAQLFYHAGMIYHALGELPAARTMLERALAVNPYFHPTQPALARATLASLTMPGVAAPTQTIASRTTAP